MAVDALKIYCNSKGKPVKRKKIIVRDGTKRHFKTSDIAVLAKILFDLLTLLGFETS